MKYVLVLLALVLTACGGSSDSDVADEMDDVVEETHELIEEGAEELDDGIRSPMEKAEDVENILMDKKDRVDEAIEEAAGN